MPPSAIFIFCAVMVCSSLAAPAQDDIFSGFLKDIYLNSPSKEREVVKRRVYPENPDSSLKQISLSALIGDLESSLYQTAMSVSGVARDNSAVVPEITPATTQHAASKRETEQMSVTEQLSRSNEQPATTEPPRVLLQTTARVASYPGNILIDRIAVQPYFGGIPIIPAFQVQHSKLLREGSNATTQISITKKTLKTAPASITTDVSQADSQSESSTAATPADALKSSTATSSTTDPTTTVTTPAMNKAEAELKEKVAEIEAEPVILSARI